MVQYFLTISDPSQPVPTIIPLGENQRLYPIAKHRLIFYEIHDIETNFIMLLIIVDFKVEPLVMSFCIDIVLKYQVIILYL